jgi:DtxR family Mn-dependent transcriptional regulator
MPTISKENYLKTIYLLSAELDGKPVTTNKLAEELNVSSAAISEMVKKLSYTGMVNYEKYKGIKTTPKGAKTALNVIRRHRLWELFLIDVLNLSWHEVHSEAELLEHYTSEYLINQIDEYLNFPTVDPHGQPIPDKHGIMRDEPMDFLMSECEIGKVYRISRVNDGNNELIKYLSKLEIKLNMLIKIEEKLSFDGSVIISADGNSHSLSEKLISNIYVTNDKIREQGK